MELRLFWEKKRLLLFSICRERWSIFSLKLLLFPPKKIIWVWREKLSRRSRGTYDISCLVHSIGLLPVMVFVLVFFCFRLRQAHFGLLGIAKLCSDHLMRGLTREKDRSNEKKNQREVGEVITERLSTPLTKIPDFIHQENAFFFFVSLHFGIPFYVILMGVVYSKLISNYICCPTRLTLKLFFPSFKF